MQQKNIFLLLTQALVDSRYVPDIEGAQKPTIEI